MNRRKFIANGYGLTSGLLLSGNLQALAPSGKNAQSKYSNTYSHRLPASDGHYQRTCGYVEDTPVSNYSWAPDSAYEDFQDIKFGIRLHWGIYSLLRLHGESWPYLQMLPEEKQAYQELYKSWYPGGFDAGEWVDLFAESGAKMFAFTSKHHDGFSMFDTHARIRKRVNWLAAGGPAIEDCDLAYSIMETPFKRDVVKELTAAAHRKGMKIDLYFSHPDWYDSDFRPYNYHPLQVPDSATIAVSGKNKTPEIEDPKKYFAKAGLVIKPNPSKEEVSRMMTRHRMQLEELLTRYGHIDMVCLDQWLGPGVWPALRDTMLHLRKISPRTMFRARKANQWKEGDNIRFTRSKNNRVVYAFSYTWPGEQLVLTTVRPPKDAAVRFLGFSEALKWEYDSAKGLIVSIPSGWKDKFAGAANLAYGFKIETA